MQHMLLTRIQTQGRLIHHLPLRRLIRRRPRARRNLALHLRLPRSILQLCFHLRQRTRRTATRRRRISERAPSNFEFLADLVAFEKHG